jgi:hypothetical protein
MEGGRRRVAVRGIVAAAALLLAVAQGVRSALGLFLSPIDTATGLGTAAIGFRGAARRTGVDVPAPVAPDAPAAERRTALAGRDFWLLAASFFACGLPASLSAAWLAIIGVWVGGLVFDATGGFTLVWLVDGAVALRAAWAVTGRRESVRPG